MSGIGVLGRSSRETFWPGVTAARAPRGKRPRVDPLLVGTTIGLACFGVLMVFSATRGPGGPDDPVRYDYLWRQALFVAVGLVVLWSCYRVGLERLRPFVHVAWLVTVAALALVLTPLGTEAKGAQAWFSVGPFQIQPGEFAKLGVILPLAAILGRSEGEPGAAGVVAALGVAGVPIGLIALQPDLGTILVFVVITMAMLLVSGVRASWLVALVALGLLCSAAILTSDVLEQYQKDRLTEFLNPARDLRGISYNPTQAQMAVSAGGFWGSGLFDGTLTRGSHVPEQQTDFIFTVVGEELGFVGAVCVLSAYAVLLWRILRAARRARDPYEALVCVGVFALFLFQIFQSVGMSIGIMPVTGLPLPLMSYGGSQTVTSFAALGFVLAAGARESG
ncbi:MAG: rod shape-determining protein RodA [Acidimicrobiales bacterium]|nr:MAG: rod shape-determining protein RodA [Acidimicrobiales bacterium]